MVSRLRLEKVKGKEKTSGSVDKVLNRVKEDHKEAVREELVPGEEKEGREADEELRRTRWGDSARALTRSA